MVSGHSQVAWLSKLTVNPLLNSAGRHAHEIRLRLADRNGIADLEFPFPQPRLYLGKAEFNTPASCVDLDSPAIKLFSGEEKVCSKQNRFFGWYRKVPFFPGSRHKLVTPNRRLTGELA